MAKYENIQSFSSGIGTDLFIKKNKPGHAVGEGYTVEIFTNGVKTEEIHKRKKTDVIDLLKEYKMQYSTDRAFQNQVQYHVTYKSKEQRGEGSSHEIEKQQDIKNEAYKSKEEISQENKNNQEGAKSMASIETTLLKQASEIERVLQRLLSPDMPIKIREAADDILNTNALPDPSPQETSLPDAMSPENIANTLAGKILTYMSSKPNVAVDEAYNNIKSWVAQVRKKINQWEKSSDTKVEKGPILTAVKKMIFDGNPETLNKALKIQVTPDVLKKTQDILSKAASHDDTKKFDSIDKVNAYINTLPDGDENADVMVIKTIKDMDPETAQDQLPKFLDKDKKNYSEKKFENVITHYLKDGDDDIEKLLGPMMEDIKKQLKLASIYFSYIDKERDNYFKFASITKGSYSPEEMFEHFVEASGLNLEDSSYVWASIKNAFTGDNHRLANLFSFVCSDSDEITKEAFHNIDSFNYAKEENLFNELKSLVKLYYISQMQPTPENIDQYQYRMNQLKQSWALISMHLAVLDLTKQKSKPESKDKSFTELYQEEINADSYNNLKKDVMARVSGSLKNIKDIEIITDIVVSEIFSTQTPESILVTLNGYPDEIKKIGYNLEGSQHSPTETPKAPVVNEVPQSDQDNLRAIESQKLQQRANDIPKG